jgi:hydroxymethylglutaryl-CoA lyase
VNASNHVHITDVGPRDGLQNEPDLVDAASKARLIDLLVEAGVREIEATSFVSPKWVPQLADAAEVLAKITRKPGVAFAALVPNEQGLERARQARVDKICVFAAASETFSRKNTNGTIAEVLARLEPVVKQALAARMPVRAYVSCAVACPYEGPIAPRAVRSVVETFLAMGSVEIDLGETIGVAVPSDIDALYDGLDGSLLPADSVLHLHDTRGTALACAFRAFQLGVRKFDASVGGLGGCPYAPGASGNLATEDLVYMFEGMGVDTGIDLTKLIEASRFIGQALGKPLRSRVYAAVTSTGSGSGGSCTTPGG